MPVSESQRRKYGKSGTTERTFPAGYALSRDNDEADALLHNDVKKHLLLCGR